MRNVAQLALHWGRRIGAVAAIAFTTCASATPLLIEPPRPAPDSIITIGTGALGGPYPANASSLTYTIQGGVIHVYLLQNGSDWGPNPPFAVSWVVGRRAAGHYTVLFESRYVPNGPVIQSGITEFDVGNPVPLPALSLASSIVLSTLLATFAFLYTRRP